MQMYKVFINDKPIILTDSFKDESIFPSYIYEEINLTELVYTLNEKAIGGAILHTLNLEDSWREFRAWFKVIQAAGGLVINEKEEILFIFRRNKWDLPKGWIEEGETVNSAAIREVEEECGIFNLTIKKELLTTYHLFFQKRKIYLKETFWFLMYSDDTKKPIPQIEEEITAVEFKSKEEIKEALSNTYANIKLVIEKYQGVIS
ncbi:NUDIX hydrolase [Tenacibaculum maritimum]|nr:NUDIX hydrolase [Tenacibaculum maritimum]